MRLFNTLSTLLWPPDPPAVDEGLADLIWEEAQRTMVQQQQVLDNLRSRSGLLLAAASIVTSFLGGSALAGGRLSIIGWSGVGLFVLCTVSVVYILLPHGGWTFSMDADDLTKRYVKGQRQWTLSEVHLDLSRWWDQYIAANQKKIDTLMYVYQAAALFLMVAILLFLLDLWVRGGSRA